MSKDTAQTLSPQATVILAHIHDKFRHSSYDNSHTTTCVFDGETSYELHPEYDENNGFYISINGHVDDEDPTLNYVPGLDAAKAEVARRMAQKVEAAEQLLATFNAIAEKSTTAEVA